MSDTVHAVIGWNDDYESPYLYEAPPGTAEDDDRSFDVEIPADLWRRHDEAAKAERVAFRALVAAAGYDDDAGRMVACCPEWVGTETPGHSWYSLVLEASGSDDEWPLNDATITTRRARDELEALLAELPDEFVVLDHHRPTVVRKDRLRIDPGEFKGYLSLCHRCGWAKDEHAEPPSGDDAAGERSAP